MQGKSFLGFTLLLLFGNFFAALGQKSTNANTSFTNKYFNWYNLSIQKNKVLGIGTDRAYTELLKGLPMTRVVVAVIDGGVDIHHEDLVGKIWENPKEIPGNNIDDDNNGFVDDVNGWNFIGGADGRDINEEALEVTRLYKKYSAEFAGMDTLKLTEAQYKDFQEFKKVRKTYIEKSNKVFHDFQSFQNFSNAFNFSDSLISKFLGKSDYTLSDVKRIKPVNNEQLSAIKEFIVSLLKKISSPNEIKDYIKHVATQINFSYNLNFNPRSIVGDDPEVWDNKSYGNNDVVGPRADHGTFVAGIIAANRHNDTGILGIADSAKIMVVRTVPDGDERDKDIANAIIYAVNNGAQVLNLSFGKDFSPQKKFVDDALRFAASKDVLIVHAAGNDAENIDTTANFPNCYSLSGDKLMDNWITVGASSKKANKELAAEFSNYGKKEVDLFAPGVRIFSLKPDNGYKEGDGTSFAAPMVAGAAALIKSVYPSLHASQIKEILLKSSAKYPKLKVYLPNEDGKKKVKVLFSSLSQTGGVLDVYEALKLAKEYVSSPLNK